MESSSSAAASFFRNRFVQVIMISGALFFLGMILTAKLFNKGNCNKENKLIADREKAFSGNK